MAENEQKQGTPPENEATGGNESQNNGTGDDRKFSQEDLEKILSKRLKRQEEKFQEEINKLKEDKKANEEQLSEAEQMKAMLDEMRTKHETMKAEAEQAKFEALVNKYANKHKVSEDLLDFITPQTIKKNEDGELDWDATFSKLAKAGNPNNQQDRGTPPPNGKTNEKTFNEMTAKERAEFLKEKGSQAYSELIRKSKSA